MTGDKNSKTPEERIAALETQVEMLKKRGGGMLSSTDFRKCVIFKRNDDDEKYAKIEAMFRKRDWDNAEAKEEIRKYKGGEDVEPRKCFIIEPYDGLNLTPFSYDLSIGNEILSVRKKDPIRKRLPYEVMPGETVIVLTREFIALPPCYSATVWPRFKLVRGGVFQSMVKIDPTWYGKLGVAMTNLSSRTIPLAEGMAFGTLVMYELSSNTDLDLWKPEQLQSVKVPIPAIPIRDNLRKELEKRKLTNICWVENNELVIRGLKKPSYEELRKIDGSKPWLDTVERAKAKWLELEHEETKRKSIGMEALGMKDLEKLTDVSPMGEALEEEKIREKEVTDDELYDVAVEYGKPFDLIANIPKLVTGEVDEKVQARLDREMGRNILPRTIAIIVSLLGFLALIVAIIGLLTPHLIQVFQEVVSKGSPAEINVKEILIVAVVVLGIIVLIPMLYFFGSRFVYWLSPKGISKVKKQIESRIVELGGEIKDINYKYRDKILELEKKIDSIKSGTKEAEE